MSEMDQRTTHTIIAEVERLQCENFNNATVTGHSLPFNHTICDSVHLNETITEFKSEFPTIELNAGLHNKITSDCDNYLPETNQTRVAANFVEEVFPTINDCAIKQENSIGAEFGSMLNQLQRQQDLILTKNYELNGQVMQQKKLILDLQKNHLELDGQVMQQHKIIFELRNQLNMLTEVHRLSFQASVGERIKAEEKIEIDIEPAAELSYRPQIEIAQVDTTMTNEQSIITNCSQTDQLQDIECAQSSTEYEAETRGNSVGQSGYSAPLSHDYNFNESHGSVIMKQVRSVPSGKGKQIKFNMESIEESPANARKSHQQRKSFTCEECKKQFNSKCELKLHSRIHTSERPYVCTVCGSAFKLFGNLKVHQRIHTGERPYVCAICGAGFKQSNHLNTHHRSHLNARPFMCEFCKKSFKHERDLSIHMDSHNRRQFRK